MQRDNYISYRTTSVDCDVVVLSVTLFIVLFFAGDKDVGLARDEIYNRLLQAVTDRRTATAEAVAGNYDVKEIELRSALPQSRARRMIKLAMFYESAVGKDISNDRVLITNASPRGKLKCPVTFASNVG